MTKVLKQFETNHKATKKTYNEYVHGIAENATGVQGISFLSPSCRE